MFNTFLRSRVAMAVLCCTSSVTFQNVEAKGLGQQNTDEILVVGQKQEGSLTSVSVDEAKKILAQVPGGIGFVDASDYQDNFTQSLGDTLVFTPGVFADTSAQRENKISIRGSGLNAGFERRGINVYRDGVPITRASGITEFQEIDPLSVKYIEVYKGGNGVRYGSNALGGAVNIVTPTGRNTSPGSSVRYETGSFDSQRINLSTVGRTDKLDYYIALTDLESDGFRSHSEVDSQYGFANIGIQISEQIETRFYLTKLQDQFELAGSVSLEDALDTPELALGSAFVPASLSFLGGPGLFDASTDDWDRNLTVSRLSNKTTIAFDQWSLEIGSWYAERELDHAITRYAGIIVQDERERGFNIRATNERDVEQGLIWSIGARHNESDNDAKRFFNEFGQLGSQRSQDFQEASNTAIFATLSYPINDSLSVVGGAQYVKSVRENEHSPLNAFDTEDDSGRLTFSELAPKIGMLWQLDDQKQLFANLSRLYEAPGISDLTSAGILPFDPLEIQAATTFEVGSRGQTKNWAWDISAYHSEIDDEFIDITDGRITVTENSVSKTTHQGIEAGIDWLPQISSLQTKGIQFVWRNVATINNFKFDNHPIYGNNSLAGIPEFNLLSDFSLNSESWKLSANIRHVSEGPYVDFSNTIQTDGYTLLGLSASWNINDSVRVFASAENITDKVYISNIGTLGLADSSSTVFTPGQGRALYAGFNLNF